MLKFCISQRIMKDKNVGFNKKMKDIIYKIGELNN